LLERLHGAARLSSLEGNLAESGQRPSPLVVGRRSIEYLPVELLGRFELAEAESDLGIEERSVLGEHLAVKPRCKPVLADPEPPAHLPEELERRDPIAGLDAGDVGRRAAVEGQLALAQTRAFACVPQSPTYRSGVVHMC
jgi:hypothetical protein